MRADIRTRRGLFVLGLIIWSLNIVSITSQELQVVTFCYIRVTRDGDIVTSEFSPGHVSVSGHWPDWPRNSCHIFTSFRFSSCSLTAARGNKMMISQFQFPRFNVLILQICNTTETSLFFVDLNKIRSVHSPTICMPSDPPFLLITVHQCCVSDFHLQ